jgi:hypothetical protein
LEFACHIAHPPVALTHDGDWVRRNAGTANVFSNENLQR